MTDRTDKPFMPDAVAARLIDDRRNNAHFHPLPPDEGVTSLERAYAVQDRFVAALSQDGNRARAGFKIGLTSIPMQQMCGLDQPIAGAIFADTVRHSPARFDLATGGHIGLEFEICVQIDAAPDPAARPYDVDTIARHIAAVGPAFEVIDDRHADYGELDIHAVVAENSLNAGAILGPLRPFDGDLAALEGVLRINGVEVDRGASADVLGHPLRALIWLVDHLAERGDHLQHGDIVLTGSIMTTRFPEPGDHFDFSIGDLGEVSVDVSSGGTLSPSR